MKVRIVATIELDAQAQEDWALAYGECTREDVKSHFDTELFSSTAAAEECPTLRIEVK